MNCIDKSTFNRLNIHDQIKIFNSLLLELDNIKDTCNHLSISYSTIRDRFHRHKYKFNKDKKQYILDSKRHSENLLRELLLTNNSLESTETIETNQGKIVVRSFRLEENVLKDFIEFCNNSNLRQYNVLSLFLMEGMNKYKNLDY